MFWFIAEARQPVGVVPNRPNRRLESALQEQDQLARLFAKAGSPQVRRQLFDQVGFRRLEHYTEGDFRQVHAVIEVAAFDAKGIVS
jgi:hypothetical protein